MRHASAVQMMASADFSKVPSLAFAMEHHMSDDWYVDELRRAGIAVDGVYGPDREAAREYELLKPVVAAWADAPADEPCPECGRSNYECYKQPCHMSGRRAANQNGDGA